MDYRIFGRRTGLRVSEIALGTGQFGALPGSYGVADDEALRILAAYADAGGNFIDTADRYQEGRSERLVGRFVAAQRDRFVLATKYSYGAGAEGGISSTGNGRKNLVRSLDASLQRLGTDYLDIYWVHAPDTFTPVEEIVRALDDAVRQGKILHAGLSNFPAWRTALASATADFRNLAPIAGIQVEYSLLRRLPEAELLPAAEALGLAATFWSPLGGGLLTGKYLQGGAGRYDVRGKPSTLADADVTDRVLGVVTRIAARTRTTPGQVALGWLLSRSRRGIASGFPILGSRTAEQLKENLEAADIPYSDESIRELDEASLTREICAGNALDRDSLRPILKGEAEGRIVPPPLAVA